MLILGIILLLIGWFTGIHLIWVLGAILAIVGVILILLHVVGHGLGGRHYY